MAIFLEMLAIVLIAAPGTIAELPDEGGWKQIGKSRRSIAIGLDAESPISGWMDEITPRLVLECRSGQPRASIELGIPAMPGHEADRRAVGFRFGSERLRQERLRTSADGNHLHLEHPVAFMSKLLEQERFTARLTHISAAPLLTSFDVSGLKPALAPLKEACRQAFEEPEESMYAVLGSPIAESYVEPEHPEKALREGVAAQLYIHAIVQLDGSLDDVRILNCSTPDYGFEEAALAAVQQWRFQPADWFGVPMRTRTTIVLFFPLPEEE